ncbi:MAG: CPBP family intramembrane glutamic endopeptidase, partial [Planktomarina sp.]|nr:CPBP family intramembrane glutamic endopeptidase [Planktomarina sp.]
MSYKLHESLVNPARQKSGIFRLLLGLVTLTLIYLVLLTALLFALKLALGSVWVGNLRPGVVTTPGQTLTLLGSFSTMAIAVGTVVLILHHRSPTTLLGGLRPAFDQFRQSIRGLFPYLIILILLVFSSQDMQPHLAIGTWLTLLPITLVLLMVQVGAEELVFRGYLQSQLAALNAPTFVWILLPSVAFGLLHYDPATTGDLAPWIVLWAILFGVAAADLTARYGTLGPAIAMHFVNNFAAITLMGVKDNLGGLNLYVYPFSISNSSKLMEILPLETFALGLAYLSIRWAMASRVAISSADD